MDKEIDFRLQPLAPLGQAVKIELVNGQVIHFKVLGIRKDEGFTKEWAYSGTDVEGMAHLIIFADIVTMWGGKA